MPAAPQAYCYGSSVAATPVYHQYMHQMQQSQQLLQQQTQIPQLHQLIQPQTQTVPQPQPQPVTQPQQQQQTQTQKRQQASSDGNQVGEMVDYTKIPIELEQKFDELDENNALRPTIINPGNTWTKKHQPSLLSEPQSSVLYSEEQKTEKNKAFDLLDALTKSGVVPIECASLHVVIASTHCFDKNIIQTVVQDNVNPIEKMENSSLLIASTIHHKAPANMISPAHIDRIRTTSALLLGNNTNNAISGTNERMDI